MKTLKNTLFVIAACVSATTATAATYVVPSDDVMIGRSDAVVIARATSSYVPEDPDGGINTFTTFAVEEVLKGEASLMHGFEVREPGGVLVKEDGSVVAKIIADVPRFADGERVLLLLRAVDHGKYAVTELGLGFMKFTEDQTGHQLVTRPLTAGTSWNIDGTAYKEPRRDAQRFVAYIRDIAHGRPAKPDYVLETETVNSGSLRVGTQSLRAAPLAVGTITAYTMVSTAGDENSQGFRWNFPTVGTVNWNRGNAETSATNNGSDSMTNAFTQWATGSSASYTLASTNANNTGVCGGACGEPNADGVNNVSFEENMTAIGVAAYVCNSGGTVAIGGISNTSGTNTISAETFFNTIEGDVSFNQGVNTCLGNATLTQGNFNTAMTHELGHTLGIRHSDKTRVDTADCTTIVAYDCSTSAIMKAFLVNGLSGALQAWDQRAIAALYPPSSAPGPPTGLVAAPTAATTIQVSWTAPVSGGVSKYHVYRCASICTSHANFSQVGGETITHPTTTYNDTASANVAYIYKVRAVNASNVESTDSNTDLATAIIFTDPTLTAFSSTVRRLHVVELRTAVTAVCTLANNPSPCANAYTDATITANVTTVKAAHINELRSKLNAARTSLSQSALSYTDSPTVTAASTRIKKAHIDELRNGVK
jgi:hypothetical protein